MYFVRGSCTFIFEAASSAQLTKKHTQLARVTAAVTTDDCRPGRGENFLPPTLISLRFLPYPLRAARARQKPPLPRRVSPGMLLPRRAPRMEPTPPGSLIRPRPPLRRLATRHLQLLCCLRAASPLGRAEEQPPPLAPSRLLLIVASGPAGPLVHPLNVLAPRRESHGRDRLWPSLRPPLLPPLAYPDGTHHVRPRTRRARGNSYFKTFTLP